MKKVVLMAIKKAKPENRLRILIDYTAQTYTLMGRGAAAPAGWTGYLPIDAE